MEKIKKAELSQLYISEFGFLHHLSFTNVITGYNKYSDGIYYNMIGSYNPRKVTMNLLKEIFLYKTIAELFNYFSLLTTK